MSHEPSRVEHLRTCHLCEALCGVVIETEGDRVVSVRGDDDDPFSRGHICPKGPALADLHRDPDRLRRPMVRKNNHLVETSWEEALDTAARRLFETQQSHGRSAVATYLGNPTVHNHGTLLFAPMLLRTLRTRNRYSATFVDQLPHHLAAYHVFGHQFLLPVPDIDRTQLLVLLGTNPLASNGSLMTAPDMKRRLRELRARGGRVVLFDPRRTETAEHVDAHHFIRPGTDALLLLGLLHVALATRGPNLGHLAPHVRNLDVVESVAKEFPPERVAAATGVSAEVIRALGTLLANTPRAAVHARMGASTQSFGALAQWLVAVLHAVTGHLDVPGGAMFTRPALDALKAAAGVGMSPGSYGRWKSRVRGIPESGGELPVATLAEDILTPGDGKIRALLTVAGNPVLSTPNGRCLDEALASLDVMVSVDCFLNETTRHAQRVLPPTSPLERSHYDAGLHLLAVRNTAKWSAPVFAPPPDARHDWQILLELKRRIEALRGGASAMRAAVENMLLAALGPDGLTDLGLRAGPYGVRTLSRDALSLAKLRASPHGVDLGPLATCLPGRLPAWHRYLDLAPSRYVADLARLRASLDSAHDGLVLIGRRHVRSNNSWMHNVPKLVAGKDRCTLIMHPDDALARGVSQADVVTVRSRVGSVDVAVELSDSVMRGVVSLPHGYGHARDGVRLGVASQHAGVSANDLTDEQDIDAIGGNAVLNGVPVEVARATPS